VPDYGLREILFKRGFRWEGRAHAPLLVANQVDGGVVWWKALRRTCERVAFELAEGLADGRSVEDFPKRSVIVEEPVADGGELFLLRHVSAGGDDDFLGADMEVVASTGGLVEASVRPPGGDVRFIGTLVIAEARVAVIASVILRTMASMGSFSSVSKMVLRGLNQSRSLCFARLRRKVRASGRKYGTAADGAGLALVAMAREV
jgi:hypothetical protein